MVLFDSFRLDSLINTFLITIISFMSTRVQQKIYVFVSVFDGSKIESFFTCSTLLLTAYWREAKPKKFCTLVGMKTCSGHNFLTHRE